MFSDAFPPIIRSSLGGPVTKITCGLAGQDVQHSHLTKLYAIAIDGPVASGKTAVGRELARRLSISFLDTGVMYRAVTWAALERGIDVGDEQGLSSLAESVHMSLVPGESGARLMVEGVDVTGHLRDAVVEEHVSQVSAVARVRVALVELQRAIAHQGPIVMVGRDIGTVVLENAEFKAFLQASVDVRAERRHEELIAKGQTVTDVVDHEWAKSIYLKDPNGISLEFCCLTRDVGTQDDVTMQEHVEISVKRWLGDNYINSRVSSRAKEPALTSDD